MGDRVGHNVSGVGRLGSRARSWDLYAFTFVLLSCLWKVINGKCKRGCKGKSILKNLSLSGWRGILLHKHVRVHNHFKSEHLLLEQKVRHLITTHTQMLTSWGCGQLKLLDVGYVDLVLNIFRVKNWNIKVLIATGFGSWTENQMQELFPYFWRIQFY